MVVKLSQEACSIIIIGIGTNDFDVMNDLDEKDELLKDCKGSQCAHRMLQFAKLKSF